MRATLIFIKNNQILLIHRFKNEREFYVFPGGGIEKNESIEAAAIREAKEETNLDIELDKKLYEYKDDSDSRVHHVFLITSFSGEMQLSGPEAQRNSEENKYILEWHDLNNISDLLIHPEKLKKKIESELNDLFNI